MLPADANGLADFAHRNTNFIRAGFAATIGAIR